MNGNGGVVAGVVGIITLTIIASMVYQYLSQKNSVALTSTVVSGGNSALTTLFKS